MKIFNSTSSSSDRQKRIDAAYSLISENSINREKFDAVLKLIHGINPNLDKKLEICSKALSTIEKLQKGAFIELSIDYFPAKTEADKKKKRALLFFLRTWKQLKNEVLRVKNELETDASHQTKVQKIVRAAKGPFGIITFVAVIIVGISVLRNVRPMPSDTSSQTDPLISVIMFDGKAIPVNELVIGSGPECLTKSNQAPHYHAKDHSQAKTLEGTMIVDPGNCGFGKVEEVKILSVTGR